MNTTDPTTRRPSLADDDDSRLHALLGGPAATHIDDDGFSRRVMSALPANPPRRWRPALLVGGATLCGVLFAWVFGGESIAQAVSDAAQMAAHWTEANGPMVEPYLTQLPAVFLVAASLLWSAFVVWRSRAE